MTATPVSLESAVCAATGAAEARRIVRLQTLWSGWGEIVRLALRDGPAPTVIVKRVQPPAQSAHPLGWGSSRSADRKRRSYVVEAAFYADHAARCRSRIPAVHHLSPGLFILEDLDAAGFTGRAVAGLSDRAIGQCLDWLADFHAGFLHTAPAGLWPEGSYWHLATRPDELAAMPPGPLRDAAEGLDSALAGARFRTLVHGDAKVANFCFGAGGVAAVDFQYVGGGCGMRDLAYFLGSAMGERTLTRRADGWVDRYFARLRSGLSASEGAAVETEWRALLPVAWADFERFLAGWSPGHRKRSGYSAQQTARALAWLSRGA